MPKYHETQLHVQTYIDRLVRESFSHPGRRNRETLIPRPSSLCSAVSPGECWGEGADAQGQVVNEQEGESKSRVVGGGNYSEGRNQPCKTQLWYLK